MAQLTTDPCCDPLRFLRHRYKSFSRRQIPLLGGTFSSPNLKFLGKFPSLWGSVLEGVSFIYIFILPGQLQDLLIDPGGALQKRIFIFLGFQSWATLEKYNQN